MNRGITQKQYLELVPPTEEDARSSQMRILDALKEKGITASFTLPALQKLYPICDEADYNITSHGMEASGRRLIWKRAIQQQSITAMPLILEVRPSLCAW